MEYLQEFLPHSMGPTTTRSPLEVLQHLWFENIGPSIFYSTLTLVIVFLLLILFSYQASSLSANLRFKLLELPLIKAFLVLLGLNLSGLQVSWYTVLFIYGWGVACFAWRWISYEKFKTEVLLSPSIENDKTFKVERVVDQMSATLECKPPILKVIDGPYPSPFVLGFLSPILVVPLHLVESLSVKEIEALLAHEVAHIARWDNLYIWQAVLLRDIMFFNPIVIFLYKMLLKEKEKNCDDLAISITGNPVQYAEMLLKVYTMMKERMRLSYEPGTIMQSLVGTQSLFSERVERIIKLPPDYFVVTGTRKFFYYVKFFILVVATIFLFSSDLIG